MSMPCRRGCATSAKQQCQHAGAGKIVLTKGTLEACCDTGLLGLRGGSCHLPDRSRKRGPPSSGGLGPRRGLAVIRFKWSARQHQEQRSNDSGGRACTAMATTQVVRSPVQPALKSIWNRPNMYTLGACHACSVHICTQPPPHTAPSQLHTRRGPAI